jgi:hypothetical protein
MGEAEFRAQIRQALERLNAPAERAIRRELRKPLDLGHSERLQFEVCPYFYGVKLVQTEEEILEDSVIPDAMPAKLQEAAEAADFDLHTAIGEELFPWFAEQWQTAGGPQQYRPANAFFHGGLDEPRYDLERRRWCSVEEVWPGEA